MSDCPVFAEARTPKPKTLYIVGSWPLDARLSARSLAVSRGSCGEKLRFFAWCCDKADDCPKLSRHIHIQ